MSGLRERIETHVALGVEASPGFFLSVDDMKEIARALQIADQIGKLREDNTRLLGAMETVRREACDALSYT